MTRKTAVHRLTPSQENYLEWIDRLTVDGPVRIRDLARNAGVRLPSVSRAVSSLARAGLVDHKSYGTVSLTEQGRRAAEQIARRDACLTHLLVDVLGMPPEAADAEVHRIEHVLGEDVVTRLEALVEHAQAHPDWLAGLAERLHRRTADSRPDTAFRIGSTRIHAGHAREKHEEG